MSVARQGDKETGRQGAAGFWLSLSPCLLVSLSFCLLPAALAQNLPGRSPPWPDDAMRAAAAAASLTGMGDLAGAASVLLAGRSMAVWEVDAPGPQPRVTSPENEAKVDADLLGGVEDRAPVRNVDQNYNE